MILSEKALPANLEAERFVLGSVLLNSGLVESALTLTPDDFTLEQNRQIFDAIRNIHQAGESIDRVSIHTELVKTGRHSGALGYMADLTEGIPETSGIDGHMRSLQEKALLRRAIFAAQHLMNRCFQADDSAGNILLDCQKTLDALSGSTKKNGEWVTPTEVVRNYPGGAHQFVSRKQGGVGIATPWSPLTEMLGGGLHSGDLFLVAGRPSMGKAQPMESRIKLRCGCWCPMGAINIGEALASVDGAPSTVTALHPQGSIEIFRVTFSDGRMAECSGEHLWELRYRGDKRLWTTDELAARLKCKRYQGRLWLPLHSGDHGMERNLPIDAYILGVLLGDGCLTMGAVYSKPDIELAAMVRAKLPVGHLLSDGVDGSVHGIVCGEAKSNTVLESLRNLGLYGKRSYERFIPSIYLDASKGQRLDLLRGLLDTDGHVQKKTGALEYSTTSPTLATGVQQLVWSLGGMCKIRHHRTSYTVPATEKRVKCRGAFRLNIWHPDIESLVSLPRKRGAFAARKRTRSMRLTVVGVEPIGKKEAQCITVSHPSGLYVTENYVVTHNSLVGMQMAHQAAKEGSGSAVFSLEMSKESLTERLLCGITRVDNQKLRAGYLNATEKSRLLEAATDLEELPLWIDDSRARTIPAMVQALRRLCAKHPVEVVVVDHLQLMTSSGKRDQRHQELSEILHDFKHEAGRMKAAFVVLSQLNRQCEIENRQPQLSDLKETGTAEEDADEVMFVHRPERYAKNHSREDLRGYAEFIVAKQRCGPVGLKPMVFLANWQKFECRAEDLHVSES